MSDYSRQITSPSLLLISWSIASPVIGKHGYHCLGYDNARQGLIMLYDTKPVSILYKQYLPLRDISRFTCRYCRIKAMPNFTLYSGWFITMVWKCPWWDWNNILSLHLYVAISMRITSDMAYSNTWMQVSILSSVKFYNFSMNKFLSPIAKECKICSLAFCWKYSRWSAVRIWHDPRLNIEYYIDY